MGPADAVENRLFARSVSEVHSSGSGAYCLSIHFAANSAPTAFSAFAGIAAIQSLGPIMTEDRLNVNFPLTVMLDIARTLDGEALDLTVRGCAVQSTKRLPEGLLVGLRLRPSPHEPPIEIAWAVVQTILPQGFGLYFASIDPADEERLRSHVESLFVATAATA